MFEQTFKNIDDVLHKEAGCSSELDYTNQTDKVIIHVELFQLPAPKFQEDQSSMQVILYGPRSFSKMSLAERVRACYQHAVIRYLSGGRMKNSTLCKRFGFDKKNAAQATKVINGALAEKVIRTADPEHPRAGYVPWWA